MNHLLNVAISVAFDGVAFAMILFIISVGLSVTMGLMGFVNLAHGSFAMVGGYLTSTLLTVAGFPFFLAIATSFVVVGAGSVVFERLLYARLYGRSELDQVLLTIGLVFMSIAACTFVWGPTTVQLALPKYLMGQIDLGFRAFPAYRTVIIGVAAVMIVGLWYGLERTRIGAQIRAAVDNRRMAQSLGIDVDRLFMLTFALGSGLAAVGGGMGAVILQLTPSYALQNLVYFLVVVAVGGLGSIRGAFIAALVIGLIDNAGKYFLPEFGAFFIFGVTIAVLLWRPAGLFGKA